MQQTSRVTNRKGTAMTANSAVGTALEEIRSARGTAYDPSVVDACLTLFRNGFDIS